MRPRSRFNAFDCEQALVKVLDVRTQNKFGVIFRGQRINDQGEIQNTHNELIVRALSCDLAVPVMPGQWWNVKGKIQTRSFINNLGFQMTEDQIEVERGAAAMVMPSGAHIVDYLTRNPRFNGIGRITAEKLWEAFREALFNILDSGDTEKLGEVVTAQKASALVEGWREEGLSNSLQWLQAQGIGLRIGRRILDYFKAEAGYKITENPYRLLSFSAGWQEVDTLAREKLNIKLDDKRRLTAAIEETVYRRFSNGDTLVSRSDLVTGLRRILKDEGHGSRLIEKAIEHSGKTGRLLFDSDGNACSLGASILENNIVDGIWSRISKKNASTGVDQIIRSYEDREGHGFKLNKEQQEAVHLIAENGFSVVTGGAGCGKTTVLKCVFAVLDEQGYDITQLALAGKAVKRMMEATNRPAVTLASFINRVKKWGITSGKKALIIDEASMVDLITCSTLMRLVDDDTKIVLVGDPHQLPPVGPGLILHCLATNTAIPHVELKVAKRFGSEIAKIANLVKDGQFPCIDQFNERVKFIEASNDEMEELGSDHYLEQPDDSVVLCATRKVARFINLKIQESITKNNKPLRLYNLEVDVWEHTGLYEGDLLICTKNHWDIGIQNGSLGKLIEIFDEPTRLDGDGESDLMALGWIEWDDGVKRPLREDVLDNLELGYALTVHKSQGSQWRRVIVCLPSPRFSQRTMIDRSMIYTAITRSQQHVTIIGNHEKLVLAVKREKAADRRNVGLPKRLATASIEWQQKFQTDINV